MPKYKVKRTFPSRETLVRGGIIEDPGFPNVGQLVRTGYLELLPDEIAPIERIDETSVVPSKSQALPPAADPVIEPDRLPNEESVAELPVIEEKTLPPAKEKTAAKSKAKPKGAK